MTTKENAYEARETAAVVSLSTTTATEPETVDTTATELVSDITPPTQAATLLLDQEKKGAN